MEAAETATAVLKLEVLSLGCISATTTPAASTRREEPGEGEAEAAAVGGVRLGRAFNGTTADESADAEGPPGSGGRAARPGLRHVLPPPGDTSHDSDIGDVMAPAHTTGRAAPGGARLVSAAEYKI